MNHGERDCGLDYVLIFFGTIKDQGFNDETMKRGCEGLLWVISEYVSLSLFFSFFWITSDCSGVHIIYILCVSVGQKMLRYGISLPDDRHCANPA